MTQNLNNPDLLVSQMLPEIGYTFIRNLYFSGLFLQIMFQLESFRGIMCHDFEEWYKI